MSKQLGFYFNAAACTGCKTCQIACKDKNDNPIGVNFRRVVQVSGGGWFHHPEYPDVLVPANVFSYNVSAACMHCQNPICVEVCPAEAMTKNEDGIVYVNQANCIGCRLCQQACPYGAPQFNEELGVMSKCNLCMDLIAAGDRPACVDACPERALDFGELSDLQAKYGTLAGIEPLPDPSLTHPSIVITPHRNSILSGEASKNIKVEA